MRLLMDTVNITVTVHNKIINKKQLSDTVHNKVVNKKQLSDTVHNKVKQETTE
jgi:dephospho-CoA kinase